MVLTAAQMTTFFEHADQMGIPHTTVIQLRAEGIEAVARTLIRTHYNNW